MKCDTTNKNKNIHDCFGIRMT